MELVFTPLLQTLHYTCKVWDICCVHGKFHPNIMLTSSRIFVYLFFPSLGRKTSWQCQYLYYDDDDDDYDFEIWPFHTCPSILRINHTKKKRVPEISKQLDLFILMLALQLSGWASQWMSPSPPHHPAKVSVSPSRGVCSRVVCSKSPLLSSSSTAGLYVSKNNTPHLKPNNPHAELLPGVKICVV